MELIFTIPGEPVGKGRPRFSSAGGHVRSFTPAKTARYENLVTMAFNEKFPDHIPNAGVVSLTVFAYFPVPKSWSKKKKASANWVTKKPDIDNVLKSVMDGLNGVAWTDDAHVAKISAYKKYSDTPQATVIINLLDKE